MIRKERCGKSLKILKKETFAKLSSNVTGLQFRISDFSVGVLK